MDPTPNQCLEEDTGQGPVLVKTKVAITWQVQQSQCKGLAGKNDSGIRVGLLFGGPKSHHHEQIFVLLTCSFPNPTSDSDE